MLLLSGNVFKGNAILARSTVRVPGPVVKKREFAGSADFTSANIQAFPVLNLSDERHSRSNPGEAR
jgi:hypothetical protein